MTPLYRVSDIRAIEREQFAVVPSFTLMQQAGSTVAAAAENMLSADNNFTAPIIALAGGGNNGGDALIAAARLRQAGYKVQVMLCADAAHLPADAHQALQQWQEQDSDGNGTLLTPQPDALPPAALLIDGLFGIGLSRPPEGLWEQLIHAANRHPAPVLAIDIASGVTADSGNVAGSAIRAAKTVTFFGGKPGLYTGDGAEHSGEIEIATLDAPAAAPAGWLLDSAPALERLRRRKNSHKGSHGTLALAGGADGMLGALVLAARAAARCGAGKTIACTVGQCPAVDWEQPDIMWRPLAQLPYDSADCIAAGMGLGTSAAAAECLARLLPLPIPLLLDADALNLLARDKDNLQQQVSKRSHETIFTPHPGEAARLLRTDHGAIERDRLAAAALLATEWQATIVLKGSGSIIQPPGQPFIICGGGNPGLARGGSGDVLAGIIAALLAQTKDAAFAASAGTWLHAAAADCLAARHGEIGMNINQLAATAAALIADAEVSDHCKD